MSDHLSVDGDGLAAAAVGSVDIAEALAAAGAVNSPAAGVQPSQAGERRAGLDTCACDPSSWQTGQRSAHR